MKTRSFGNATLYIFENKQGMKMEVTDFGATLYALTVPDKDGNPIDVVLGYDSPEGYLKGDTNFGGTIGRNGNRIGNATFVLNGKTYQLDKNDNDNNHHSGYDQYNLRMWNVKQTTERSITFSLHSPAGDQGYPGTFDVEVTYTLTDDNEVCIEYIGVPDEDTIVNMTNHSYFNLNGHASGDVLSHYAWVDADDFLVTSEQLVPTGEICSVDGTPMDFRVKKIIGRDIENRMVH